MYPRNPPFPCAFLYGFAAGAVATEYSGFELRPAAPLSGIYLWHLAPAAPATNYWIETRATTKLDGSAVLRAASAVLARFGGQADPACPLYEGTSTTAHSTGAYRHLSTPVDPLVGLFVPAGDIVTILHETVNTALSYNLGWLEIQA